VKIDLTKWEGRQLDVASVTVCVALALAVYLGGLRPLRQSHDALVGRREALSVQQSQAARLEAARVAIQHRLDEVAAPEACVEHERPRGVDFGLGCRERPPDR